MVGAMAVRDTLSAKVVSTGSSVKNFFVGEKSTFKTTEDVLRAEYEAIWGRALPQTTFEAAYRKDVQNKRQAALCLSGGGIRSAAFSLGVLQVLAYRGLLTQFQYLSTVSGGGYIGGLVVTLDRRGPGAECGQYRERARKKGGDTSGFQPACELEFPHAQNRHYLGGHLDWDPTVGA